MYFGMTLDSITAGQESPPLSVLSRGRRKSFQHNRHRRISHNIVGVPLQYEQICISLLGIPLSLKLAIIIRPYEHGAPGGEPGGGQAGVRRGGEAGVCKSSCGGVDIEARRSPVAACGSIDRGRGEYSVVVRAH